MRTLIIFHEGAKLDEIGLTRWLGSFSQLVGIVVLRETKQRVWRRIRRELKRTGPIRFLDSIGFRLYYKLFLARKDRKWEDFELHDLCRLYPETSKETPILLTHSPNSAEAERFIRNAAPDIMIARCKTLLKEEIFRIPSKGTFVMHPGICPEYRNAHGCFWALANDDLTNVGMTLLRIDTGVDTGPVYGHYRYNYDEVRESHVVIQHRVVLENLDHIKKKLTEVDEGSAVPLATAGRPSRTWGQPWLTQYLKWKCRARRRASKRAVSLLYHDVVRDGDYAASGFSTPGADRYKLQIDEFEKHLAALARAVPRGFGVIHDLLDGIPMPYPLFLTFDDGGSSAHTSIADLLEKHGWRGHFLVTTDYIGKRGFLTKEQIRDLRQRGHMIGTHSASHPHWMSRCSWKQLVDEWATSVRILSDLLGEQVIVASVPGGHYSKQVARAASHSGIKVLFNSEPTTRSHQVDGCLVLGRYTIIRGMSPALAARIACGSHASRLRQFVFWNTKKTLKLLWGEAYLRVRNLALKQNEVSEN
jgi:peptidoglycan/xylan/chitin deacetylase (PgdA/CDA1 family)